MTKQRYNFTLGEATKKALTLLAEWNSRSESNMLEVLIQDSYKVQSKAYKAALLEIKAHTETPS